MKLIYAIFVGILFLYLSIASKAEAFHQFECVEYDYPSNSCPAFEFPSFFTLGCRSSNQSQSCQNYGGGELGSYRVECVPSASCGHAPTPTPAPTNTPFPTPVPTNTPTPIPPTATPTPTPTPLPIICTPGQPRTVCSNTSCSP